METKQIIFCVLLFFLVCGGIYFLIKKPNSGTKKNDCSHCGNLKCNPDTGECILPDVCNGNPKPDDKCEYVCIRNKWVCKGSDPCENIILPTDIGSCKLEDLVCDPDLHQLYCPSSSSCNQNRQYFNGVSRCSCPSNELGSKCQFTNTTCNSNGTLSVDEYDNPSCACNQPYYGKNCEKKCDFPKIYDSSSGKCICDPKFYSEKDGTCIIIPCANGKITKDGCTCNDGFTYDSTNKTCNDICKTNQVYNKVTKKCECLPSKDGQQYVGPNCKVINCHLNSEAMLGRDGNPYCDCTVDKDSCGINCQYNRKDTCNGNGIPVCTNNTFNGCKCDDGYAGTDCSCKISDKPSDANPCLGKDYVCQNGIWVPSFKTCDEIKTQYGGLAGWNNACFKTLSDGKYYSGAITGCTDGKPVTPIFTGCIQPTQTCSKNQVNLCDESTLYKWECKDQVHTDGTCPPLPIGNYCINENGQIDNPVCFKCGPDGGAEWICKNEGAMPSKTCLSKLGINEIDNVTGISEPIYVEGQSGLPVFPTTDSQKCLDIISGKSTADPFYNGQIGDYNVSALYPNPTGTFNQETKTYVDLENGNVNPYFMANGSKCSLPDDQILKYILKTDSKQLLCSGDGVFNQDGHTLSGKCVCNAGFKGNNCQYGDSTTCSGNGTVDDNGICKCNSGHYGTNCNLTDANCPSQPGVQNGKLTGANGNTPICDYSALCTTKFPRCQTCANTNNYQNMSCQTPIFSQQSLFTNCIPRPDTLSGNPAYGCQINRDTAVWSPYTGISCHRENLDINNCKSGANWHRVSYGGTVNPTSDGEGWNYCYSSDFTQLPGLNTVSKEGLQNTSVSGIGLSLVNGSETMTINNSKTDPYIYVPRETIYPTCWNQTYMGALNSGLVPGTDWFGK